MAVAQVAALVQVLSQAQKLPHVAVVAKKKKVKKYQKGSENLNV